jgi:hypothetical protein
MVDRIIVCGVLTWSIKTQSLIIQLININNTGNVHKMWHWDAFMQPFLPWKSNKYDISLFWGSVCGVSYHAPYCHLWPVQLFVSYHIISNDNFWKKKPLLNTKCVFWFSLQCFSKIFLILRITEQDMIKNIWYIGLHVKYPLFSSTLN